MDIYKTYAEIEKEIAVLEAKKKAIREEIAAKLPEEGFKDETINAFWTVKKKWTYSPKVVELETNLKEIKKIEEETGEAKFEEAKQLTIKVK